MLRRSILVVLLGLFCNLAAFPAEPAREASRSELLYSTHCIACHTERVHWREKKLATDWATLQAQVRRWQGNISLGWDDADITEVARYLNRLYYRYPAPD